MPASLEHLLRITPERFQTALPLTGPRGDVSDAPHERPEAALLVAVSQKSLVLAWVAGSVDPLDRTPDEPSLEEIFLHHYGDGNGRGAG